MPSTFRKPLIIQDNGDFTFTLIEGFEYNLGFENSNITINIPSGYITDFASVPRIFWNIFPPHGPWGKAAVVHDYLYNMVEKGNFDRNIADAIFKEAMEVLGTSAWRRWIMYLAVRLFGGFAIRFGKKRNKNNIN